MREVEKLSEENLGPAAPATGSVYTTHHSVSGDKLPSMALLTLDFILCIQGESKKVGSQKVCILL